MRTEVRTVTPADAQRWLDGRAPNRSLDSRLSLKMARDMIAGRWLLTHQGIAFDGKGRLVDGQHRLAAVVLADKPVEMLASWDLDDGAQLVMDDHRRRSGADVLSISLGRRFSTLAVAVLQFMENPHSNRYQPYSKPELEDAAELYGPAVAFVEENLRGHVRGVTTAPVLAPVARAWYGRDRERLKLYLEVLTTGIPKHTPDDTAALRLRDWLISHRELKRRPTRWDLYARSQNSLRHFLERRDVSQVRAVDEDLFPLPESLRRPRSLHLVAKGA